MITISKSEKTTIKDEGKYVLVELRGLSTDTKPTEYEGEIKTIIDNGSIFIEINTGKIYMYDLDGEQWKEI